MVNTDQPDGPTEYTQGRPPRDGWYVLDGHSGAQWCTVSSSSRRGETLVTFLDHSSWVPDHEMSWAHWTCPRRASIHVDRLTIGSDKQEPANTVVGHDVPRKNWRWMPGMLALWMSSSGQVQSARADEFDAGAWNSDPAAWAHLRPDFGDPATLGCLRALMREAWGDPYASCYMLASGWPRVTRWVVVRRNKQGPKLGRGWSEPEALKDALESAP